MNPQDTGTPPDGGRPAERPDLPGERARSISPAGGRPERSITSDPAGTPDVALEGFRLARGANLATFTVRIGPAFRLHGVRLVAARNGGRFVGWPRGTQDPVTGRWRPLTVPPPDVADRVRDLASAAWKAATAPTTTPEVPDDPA